MSGAMVSVLVGNDTSVCLYANIHKGPKKLKEMFSMNVPFMVIANSKGHSGLRIGFMP